MSPWHIFELFFNLQNIMIDLFSKFIDLDYLSFILFGVTFSWEREVFSLWIIILVILFLSWVWGRVFIMSFWLVRGMEMLIFQKDMRMFWIGTLVLILTHCICWQFISILLRFWRIIPFLFLDFVIFIMIGIRLRFSWRVVSWWGKMSIWRFWKTHCIYSRSQGLVCSTILNSLFKLNFTDRLTKEIWSALLILLFFRNMLVFSIILLLIRRI